MEGLLYEWIKGKEIVKITIKVLWVGEVYAERSNVVCREYSEVYSHSLEKSQRLLPNLIIDYRV